MTKLTSRQTKTVMELKTIMELIRARQDVIEWMNTPKQALRNSEDYRILCIENGICFSNEMDLRNCAMHVLDGPFVVPSEIWYEGLLAMRNEIDRRLAELGMSIDDDDETSGT